MSTDNREELEILKKYKEESWDEIITLKEMVKTLFTEVESLKSAVEKKDGEIKYLKKVLGVDIDEAGDAMVYARRARSQVIKLGSKRGTWNDAIVLNGDHNKELVSPRKEVTLSPRLSSLSSSSSSSITRHITVDVVSKQSPETPLKSKTKSTPLSFNPPLSPKDNNINTSPSDSPLTKSSDIINNINNDNTSESNKDHKDNNDNVNYDTAIQSNDQQQNENAIPTSIPSLSEDTILSSPEIKKEEQDKELLNQATESNNEEIKGVITPKEEIQEAPADSSEAPTIIITEDTSISDDDNSNNNNNNEQTPPQSPLLSSEPTSPIINNREQTPITFRRLPSLLPPSILIPSLTSSLSSLSPSTPSSTPCTPNFPNVPPNTPSSPSSSSSSIIHPSMLFRPKLPARMAAELVSKQGTLKRTEMKRNFSESLKGLWSPPDVLTRSPSDSSVEYSNILSTSTGSVGSVSSVSSVGSISSSYNNSIDSENEFLKPPLSPTTASLYSPDSSDSEDSMLSFKKKYENVQLLEPDTLNNYEVQRVIQAQKIIRGWIERKRLAKIKKRTEAMKELLNTELGYAKSLDLLIHHYVKPLRNIKQASSMMLADLDSLTKKWNYYSCVGSVMLSHVEQLHSHMPFVVNYERSQQVLATCTKSKEFAAFLKRRMISAELDYKTLDDFLILPVQRIPRYIMLLEAIYKYTPINHPDRDILRKASHQMRLFAEKINRRKAAKIKLMEFLTCLKGYDGDFYEESRYLVREGSITNERKRPRYCALMNDLVVVCKPPEMPKATKRGQQDTTVKKPSYKYVAHIKLDGSTNLQVRPVAPNAAPNVNTPYIISLKSGNVNITLITLPEDGKGWPKDMLGVLEALRKK